MPSESPEIEIELVGGRGDGGIVPIPEGTPEVFVFVVTPGIPSEMLEYVRCAEDPTRYLYVRSYHKPEDLK